MILESADESGPCQRPHHNEVSEGLSGSPVREDAHEQSGPGHLLAHLGEGKLRLEASAIQEGITRVAISNRWSRWQRFEVTCYLVDDLLIDTGFPKIEALLARYLSPHRLKAIGLTHNHEDHAGNAGSLAKAKACPVYMSCHERVWSDGVRPMPAYRRLWWGQPAPYEPLEMPEKLQGGNRSLSAIRTPGHSDTHTVFFEESTGILFAGDLFVSSGVTAVMSHENPYWSIDSLKRVAALEPEWLLNGHGLSLRKPAESLRRKAEMIEEKAGQIMEYHRRGLNARAIMNRVFKGGQRREWFLTCLTAGEFSRLNFVKACISKSQRETCDSADNSS